MTTPKLHRKEKTAATPKKGRQSTKDFDVVLREVTSDMPTHKRVFSNAIHTSTVSSFSDAVSTTIARPNAVLFGAIASFALTLGAYLFSKNLGYSLSGSEPVVAFGFGWIVGILYDVFLYFFKKK